jgi:hypothetical protein
VSKCSKPLFTSWSTVCPQTRDPSLNSNVEEPVDSLHNYKGMSGLWLIIRLSLCCALILFVSNEWANLNCSQSIQSPSIPIPLNGIPAHNPYFLKDGLGHGRSLIFILFPSPSLCLSYSHRCATLIHYHFFLSSLSLSLTMSKGERGLLAQLANQASGLSRSQVRFRWVAALAVMAAPFFIWSLWSLEVVRSTNTSVRSLESGRRGMV